MNPTILRQIDRNGNSVEQQSDTMAELIRHCLDLRIHALIMIGTAVLAAYCGFRASGASNDSIVDDPGPMVAPTDALSMFACLVFVAISIACLAEAHRFWRRAAVIRFKMKIGESTTTVHRARSTGAIRIAHQNPS